MLCVILSGCTTTPSGTAAPLLTSPTSPSATATSTPSTTTTEPVADTRSATAIVEDRHARLGAFSVIPGHPARRAATWYTCRDAHCDRRSSAAVVTADGFGHRVVVDLPVSRNYFGYGFQPAGPRHFVVTVNARHPRLVDLHGHVQDITVAGTTGPLAPGEVAVGGKALRHWLAVDPDTGVGHPLSTPQDTAEVETEPGGQLRALTIHFDYFWSDDGGTSWHHLPLPSGERQLLVGMIPTTDDSVHALQLGGDGATLFPWDHVLKSSDGRTWTSYDGPSDPEGYADPVAVLPGGRLLLDLDGWSDARAHRPPARPIGLYAGADWADLRAVALAGPFAHRDPHTFEPTILDVAVTTRSVTICALIPDQRAVVSSSDGGTTWRVDRAR